MSIRRRCCSRSPNGRAWLPLTNAFATSHGSDGRGATSRADRAPLRDDIATHEPGYFTDDILASLPKRSGRFALVKKILSNDNA